MELVSHVARWHWKCLDRQWEREEQWAEHVSLSSEWIMKGRILPGNKPNNKTRARGALPPICFCQPVIRYVILALYKNCCSLVNAAVPMQRTIIPEEWIGTELSQSVIHTKDDEEELKRIPIRRNLSSSAKGLFGSSLLELEIYLGNILIDIHYTIQVKEEKGEKKLSWVTLSFLYRLTIESVFRLENLDNRKGSQP